MADYSVLKAAIRAAIYDNEDQDITGDALQGILLEMVDELGQSYVKPATGIPSTDMAQAVQDALALASAAYQKPAGGIPASDMAQAVKDALAAAGTAYQKPVEGIPASDMAPGVIPDVPESVVQYIAQSLTAEQKAQARTNIGAGTSDFSGNYNDLSNKPSIPDPQVNADWDAESGVAQILHKPSIPDPQIQSDWDQTDDTKADYIKNKPTIGGGKNVWYGTCPTAAATGVKVVTTSSGDFTLQAGNVLLVVFSSSNTQSAAYLQVDGQTSKRIYSLDGTSDVSNRWGGGELCMFVYDGTNFIMLEQTVATPNVYGITKLSSATDSTSTSLAATASAVKAAYDHGGVQSVNGKTGAVTLDIPTLNLFIVTVGYDSGEDEYSITNGVSFADLCAAFDAGKALLLIYTDEDGYAQQYTLSDYAEDDGYLTFAATFSPGIIKGFTIGDDDSVTYGEAKASTSDFTNNSMFVRGNNAIWQGTSITSAGTAAKTASISGFTASDLAVGVMVVVTFANTNIAAPNNLTLNIASRGAKPIKRWVNGGLADIDKPESLTGTMAFVYDGSYWVTWYESFDNDDGNCLDAKFGNVSLHQWKPDYTMTDGYYVKGADGLLYEYSGSKYVEVAVGDAERVRFLGIFPKYSSWTNGFAFGKYESDQWVTIESEKFDYDTSQEVSLTKEYIRAVPPGATHFRTSSASSSLLALERNFYLYLQTGKPAVSQEEMYAAVHPAVQTSQPAGGMAPNVLYRLGTLTGSVTFSLASPSDATVENEYKFTFDTGGTAPTPSWPNSVTSWVGNCLNNGTPSLSSNKHYEVSIVGAYGIIVEF